MILSGKFQATITSVPKRIHTPKDFVSWHQLSLHHTSIHCWMICWAVSDFSDVSKESSSGTTESSGLVVPWAFLWTMSMHSDRSHYSRKNSSFFTNTKLERQVLKQFKTTANVRHFLEVFIICPVADKPVT